MAHGLHGRLHRAVTGHEQDDRRATRLLQPLQEGEAVHFRQHEVRQHHRRVLGLDEIQRLLAGGGGLDFVPPLPDETGEAFALGRLVVDDEDLARLHLVASAGTHVRLLSVIES